MKTLIIFAKPALAGQVKTRLGACLGSQAAAGVYSRLLHAYLLKILPLCRLGIQVRLAVADDGVLGRGVIYFEAAWPEYDVVSQSQGDLGSRMSVAFTDAFASGSRMVVLTGSDIPGLSQSVITKAFAALEHQDLVLGPARDGGYYLIGQRSPGADLFNGIAWSTTAVLAQTRQQAMQLHLTWQELELLMDIDYFEDYQLWRASLLASGFETASPVHFLG